MNTETPKTRPLDLYEEGADQVAAFFEAASLPVPENTDYFRTSEGGRLVLLTPFACTIRIMQERKRLQGDHPHALKPLFSCAAGNYHIDVNPGIITPVPHEDVKDITVALAMTGLKMLDDSQYNYGVIPGSSPAFPVVLDLDNTHLEITSKDAIPLSRSVQKVKDILDKNYALAGKKAPETPQNIYDPLRDTISKAFRNGSKQLDTGAMREFWKMCAEMKQSGKMVSPWDALKSDTFWNPVRIDIPKASTNYEKKLRDCGLAP